MTNARCLILPRPATPVAEHWANMQRRSHLSCDHLFDLCFPLSTAPGAAPRRKCGAGDDEYSVHMRAESMLDVGTD